jgi:hypothetical protein
MHQAQRQNYGPSSIAGKVAAIFEVLGIFVAGNFTAGRLQHLLGIKPLGSLIQSAINATEPDFIALSVGWLQVMGVQYACLLPPAFAIGWWRRRLSLQRYGVTRAGKPVSDLIVLGFVGFALALLVKLLWVANRFIARVCSAYWALLDKSWTPTFWLFLGCRALPCSVLEELFSRLLPDSIGREDFRGIGASHRGTLNGSWTTSIIT